MLSPTMNNFVINIFIHFEYNIADLRDCNEFYRHGYKYITYIKKNMGCFKPTQ